MRSEERTRDWLEDIADHIDHVDEFIHGLSEQQFSMDKLRIHAVVRCLEIVSEASRRLPDELKQRHPKIGWPGLAAIGNVYRHEYHRIEPELVWRTAVERLPPLRAVVEQELANLPPP